MAKVKGKKSKDTTIDVSEKKKKKAKSTSSAVMPIQKDSYIIVRVGSKHKLALAINPERGRCVIDETLADDEPQHVEFDENNLVANLGLKPKPGGSAFGVKIEPYVSSTESKYGPLHFFRELNDREKKSLKKALRSTYDKMLENNLNVFPFSMMKFLPKRGKYAGCYKYRRKMSDVWDSVELHPETLEDAKYNEYVLFHEYGHAVWYKMITSSYKAKWIKLYHKRLELTSILKDRLEPMLDELLQFSGNLKDFYKDLDDEDRLVFREVLSHYKRYHKLDGYSLDILHIEDTEKFASMWPKRTTIVEGRPDLGDYSLQKPEEFWAEAFAFHMTGRQMPKDITKAMEKTLKVLHSV